MSKPRKRPQTPHDPAVQRKADEMISRLREYHRLGLECNLLPTRKERREFADQHAISQTTIRKVRALAREYTSTELDELCRLRKPDRMPFHFGYIPYFLCCHGKKERQKLQRQAAENGWTAPEVHVAIRQMRGGRRGGGGRPMKKPATAEAGLVRITADGHLWVRRCELVLTAFKTGKPDGDLRDYAEEAVLALRAVEKTARSATKELEAMLGPRSGR
ncbi:MAG: hypothetical protein GX575_06725 [Candidatus Anammoximicrobium sp.]|nr:hypothetical protein [Candidatus Anammoximicrobium sp.]